MAKMMNVPILGVVENMSYVECPDCGKKIEIFGKSKAEEIAAELGVPVLATLPVDPHTAELVDEGKAVGMDKPGIDAAFDKILEQL